LLQRGPVEGLANRLPLRGASRPSARSARSISTSGPSPIQARTCGSPTRARLASRSASFNAWAMSGALSTSVPSRSKATARITAAM
jgi:hypothetical protein